MAAVPAKQAEWYAQAEPNLNQLAKGLASIKITEETVAASGLISEQFLSFRTIWPDRKHGKRFLADLWLESTAIDSARHKLKNWSEFQSYLGTCGSVAMLDPANIFSLVHLFQDQVVSSIPDDRALGPLDMKGLKVNMSPRYSTRRTTRVEDPTTPTKSIPGAGLEKAMGDLEIYNNLSPADSPDTLEMSPGPRSPPNPAFYQAADDEQIVNIALISLLNAVSLTTMGAFRGRPAVNWSIARKKYKIPGVLEARTDGYLHFGRTREAEAIVEVKARVRDQNGDKIRYQETAQMVAWIHAAESGLIYKAAAPVRRGESLATQKYQRLLISQDHQFIYVTVADYDRPYKEFVLATDLEAGHEANRAVREKTWRSFLIMQEYGPFDTKVAGDMKELATIVLAFAIGQDRGRA